MSCAIELAQQKPTRKHIDFALSRVRMLIHFGVKPYLVFDGDYLPSKAHTEKERAAKRKASKKLGLELLGMGRISQAHLELQKAVDVTPSMARELIEELKRLDVPYVVAPYEADSQLAYLEKQGIISGVLSEDSDLLVFGVKCLLTKLDQYGDCVMVNRDHFTACREISLIGWTDKEFRLMAMLSGCDYLPGIDKMGLKTAYRLVRKHKVVERVVRTVQFDGKMKVPAGYLEAFTKAERTFLYQWVFCPEARCLINLNKLPVDLAAESMPYIGKGVEPEVAIGVAIGDLDPNTKQRLTFNDRRSHPASHTKPAQTPDEKQGKPISEFFKAKRTPLAELDPNSFTPSPSQQRLLENQRGSSWSASQVPSGLPSALPRVTAANGPLTAPQATRRALSDKWPDTLRASPKRQRLCSDSALASSMQGNVGLQTATSRFFSKQSAQPSPSLRKASRKQDEFELWSDDSAAEVVAALTATPEATPVTDTPSPKKRKKLRVYEDPGPALEDTREQECEDDPSAETSQDTIGTTTSAETQSTAETAVTSFEVEEPKPKQTVFSKGIDVSFAGLKSRYGFETTPSQQKVPRTKSAPQALRSPLEDTERKTLLGRLVKPAPSITVPANKQSPAKQIQETKVMGGDENTVVPMSSPVARASTSQDDGLLDDDEWLALEQRGVSSRTELLVHGSEDLLVPNSPESAEEEGVVDPKLELGQFVFSG